MENLGIFYDHLELMVICYILWHFGIFSPVLVFLTKKNLATLLEVSQPSVYKTFEKVSSKKSITSPFITLPLLFFLSVKIRL
jgi:hypothetical protein